MLRGPEAPCDLLAPVSREGENPVAYPEQRDRQVKFPAARFVAPKSLTILN
jgi:hypothetical protein